jgi:hypothetical protein
VVFLYSNADTIRPKWPQRITKFDPVPLTDMKGLRDVTHVTLVASCLMTASPSPSPSPVSGTGLSTMRAACDGARQRRGDSAARRNRDAADRLPEASKGLPITQHTARSTRSDRRVRSQKWTQPDIIFVFEHPALLMFQLWTCTVHALSDATAQGHPTPVW